MLLLKNLIKKYNLSSYYKRLGQQQQQKQA